METNKSPIFPSIFRDFVKMFPDESACPAYWERLRWPNGFVCGACGAQREPWRQTRGRLVCPACRHQSTITAGTIFDKTRTPLTTWFDAAWHMLHRFRVAMVRTTREPLSGEVEVDETMIGGVEEGGKQGRGTNKEIVVIAVEIKPPKGFGRIRMRHVDDASAKSLGPFVREMIVSGSILCTDGWRRQWTAERVSTSANSFIVF